MKKYLIKSVKGVTVILVFQFIVLVSAIVFYSCTKLNENPDRILQQKEVAKLNLLIKEKKPQLLNIRSLYKESLHNNVLMSNGQRLSNNNTSSYAVSPEFSFFCESEIQSVYNQSKVVISAYGISEEDLTSEWGIDYDAEAIIKLSLSIAAYEAENKEIEAVSIKNSIFLSTSAYAKQRGMYDCLKDALGIEGVYEVLRQRALSTYAGKKMLIKAVGKVATRSLGWVGAALAVGDFVNCYWG